MAPHDRNSLRSLDQLFAATGLAVLLASALLIVAVLPAEYGIDPTGVGHRLGLQSLARKTPAGKAAAPITVPPSAAPGPMGGQGSEALRAQAARVFGVRPDESFDAVAAVRHATAPKTESMTVTLPPGGEAEVKAVMAAGDSLVFQWTATGDVDVDTHGERPGAKDEYTSYLVDGAKREGAGSLTAPFAGMHGWYWLNRGSVPVTVKVSVTGFQSRLFQPGH